MSKKILAVDDEPDMLEILSVMLESGGYEVLKAPNAEQALMMLERYFPDLILLDLHLPGMQGADLCKSLKADMKTRKIPIILFSVSSQGMYTRTREIGADDFIVKPFGVEQIMAKIKKFIGK